MGWMGELPYEYHLYEFDIKEENLRITNDVEAYEENKFYKSQYKNVKLDKKNDQLVLLRCIYDFGDDWQHLIILESMVIQH
jgi:hypothetical protein